MKRKIQFNLRELAGSMGDFGTLFPLVVGYIAICGVDPSGLLITIGIANIVTGIVYRLPMPIEPMKVIAITAIAQRWDPALIQGAGVATGLIWIFFAFSGLMDRLAAFVPKPVVKGIQLGLGLLLAKEAVKMISTSWILGIGAFIVILFLKDSKIFPAAVVLVAGGIAIMALEGDLSGITWQGLSIPEFHFFDPASLWDSMVLAGFAQIPLTVTNAVIATAAMIKEYWPDSRVSEKQLAANMGVMNLMLPFLGGIPLCHGAGGLAGQYAFGARTGGTNLIEGAIEISLGLFLGSSIALLFSVFPVPIIGAMMFYVGFLLVRTGVESLRGHANARDALPMVVTAFGALMANMAVGFAAGTALYYLLRKTGRP